MASLMARRRLPTAAAGEVDAQRYLDTVTAALADGRMLGGEAQTLARLAGSAGLGAAQVEALHARIVEHLRAAALTDTILTTVRSASSGRRRAGSACRRTSTSSGRPRRRTWSRAARSRWPARSGCARTVAVPGTNARAARELASLPV